MKSIKTYIVPLVLIAFFSAKGLSQNTINEKHNENNNISLADSILIYGYFTEKDYNKKYEVNKSTKTTSSEIYYDHESNSDKDSKDKENNSFLNEVATEVIVEVVVNTLFFIAAIWH